MAPSVGNYTVEFFRSAFRRGYGFSQDYHVLLDDNPLHDQPCFSISRPSCVCHSLMLKAGQPDSCRWHQTETLPNAYEYTQSQTPVIRSITPAEEFSVRRKESVGK